MRAAGLRVRLQPVKLPHLAPLVDTRHDFDVHHPPADTLDKSDPDALRRQVAVLAVPVWFLAEVAEPIPAAPAAP